VDASVARLFPLKAAGALGRTIATKKNSIQRLLDKRWMPMESEYLPFFDSAFGLPRPSREKVKSGHRSAHPLQGALSVKP
jgi:hypothetical protein